jgi:hypothetical protein
MLKRTHLLSFRESGERSSECPCSFESKELREGLRKGWVVAGHWYPLAKFEPDSDRMTFHQELWESRKGMADLLRAMQKRGIWGTRQGCLKMDLFSGDGVLELKKLGVQEIASIAGEAGEIFKGLAVRAVQRIADQGMADGCQMDSDLMRAARIQAYLKCCGGNGGNAA